MRKTLDSFDRSRLHRFLDSAEQTLRRQLAIPTANLLLLIPARGEGWLQLHPKDMFDGPLNNAAMGLKISLLEGEQLAEYLGSDEFPVETRQAWVQCGIRSAAIQPISITGVGTIAMLATSDPSVDAEHLLALLKRIAGFVERLIELGLQDSPMDCARDPDGSNDPMPNQH